MLKLFTKNNERWFTHGDFTFIQVKRGGACFERDFSLNKCSDSLEFGTVIERRWLFTDLFERSVSMNPEIVRGYGCS